MEPIEGTFRTSGSIKSAKKTEKGEIVMTEEKDTKQGSKDKKPIDPGSIKGKIDVSDTRERRDGPGGN